VRETFHGRYPLTLTTKNYLYLQRFGCIARKGPRGPKGQEKKSMKVVNEEGKARLWVRRGAVVVGPKTYDCRKVLKSYGADWIPSAKGWGFREDYIRAKTALKECAKQEGLRFVDDKRRTTPSYTPEPGDGYHEIKEIMEKRKYGIDG